jgi:hypothetical protein
MLINTVGTGNLLIKNLPFISYGASIGGLQVMASVQQGAAVKLLLTITDNGYSNAIPHNATNALFTSTMLTAGNRIYFSVDYETI